MNFWRPMAVAVLAAGWLTALAPRDGQAAPAAPMTSLAVGHNADGRMEVFFVDGKGGLRHRWQRESTHDWSSWSGLGGTFSPGVAVTSDLSGRMVIFAVERDTKTVVYNRQKEPNSPAWSSWIALRGQKVEGPVAAAPGPGGLLEIFAVGAEDHAVKHIVETEGPENWAGWTDLGGLVEPGLQVVRNSAGRLEVFGISADGGWLVHCSQGASGWSAWSSLGQRLRPGFAVGPDLDGRLELFGVDAESGEVVRAFQVSPAPDSPWSPWIAMGAKMKAGIIWGRNKDGRLEIFTVSPTNDMIYHTFQFRGGGTNWVNWTDMSLIGGLTLEARRASLTPNEARLTDLGAVTRSYPAISTNLAEHLEIFAFDERLDDVLYHRLQIAGNLSWTDWSSLDRPTAQYLSRAWRIDEGLPDNRVQAITQTPDGYIWVGTHNGLAKFDGVHFVPVDLFQALALTNFSVTSLLVDSGGALWIGFDGDGVARIDKGEVRHYGKADGLAGERVTMVYEDTEKTLWIGTTTGLSHYKGGKFVNYTAKDGLGADSVQSVLEDAFGNLWVATSGGLSQIKGTIVKTLKEPDGLPGDLVKSIWQDVPGRLWIGSNRGLVLYRNARFYAYDKSFGLSDRLVNVICGDRQGNLWVGTYSGLTRFEEGRFVEDFENEGSSLGKINALFEDREGDLWAGSQNGLFRLVPKRLLLYDKRQGLTQNNVTSVIENDAGSLWVGTSGGGVSQLNDQRFTTPAAPKGFPLDWIVSLCKGRDGSLWLGVDYNSGLAQIKDDKLIRYTQHDGLAGGAVRVVHEDRAGRLWAGTDHGLSCLQDGKFSTYTVRENLAGNLVRDLCEDPEGNLWIGTESGLSLWKDGHFSNFTIKDGLSDNVITSLYLDRERSLWIGTQNGGLNRFHNGRFSVYNAREGLFSNEILAIVEDDFGWLWMTCSKGVFRVAKSDLDAVDARQRRNVTSIAYGHDDGMESILCSAGKPGGWKTRDGELWFPTSLGLVAMDPRAMGVNPTPPPVYIEQIIAGRKSLLHQDDAFSTAGPLAPVQIPPGRNELEFHYTALNFPRPERIRFRYKLDGVDPDWIEADSRRVAYYNNLRPGRYSFRVTACNSDGVWSEKGAAVAIDVLPHFWETWLFLSLCGLVTATSIGGVSRYATKKKMERKLQQVQQQHAVELERTRIARDMHDELGAKLTRISFQGAMARRTVEASNEAAPHIDKMAQTARELVCSLDEIVWAVEPKNDSLDGLATYVCRYAGAFFEDCPIQCKFVIPAHLPDYRLTTDVRHNLFLAVKESLNNVLKHSGASRVEVQIVVGRETFEICISDNGCGLPQAGSGKSIRVGRGLANLNERLDAIQGHCEVTSAPGRGTAIRLIVPLAPVPV